jgi:hypothetical protein
MAREEVARRERTGTSEPGAGWIRQITVTHSPRFAPNSVLVLQKATVMTSKHSVGKTALMEWISAASTGTMPSLAALVAAALPARDPAAVVPFNRGSPYVAALSWTDANSGVGVVPPTFSIVAGVAVVEVPPGLHIYLGHLDALSLDRSDERSSQHRCGRQHSKSGFHHVGVLLGPEGRNGRGR